jgi:hypothetical protein
VTVLTVIAVVPFALSGLDPFKAGVPVLIGFGSFGIIFLQAYAALAILVYLRRHGGEPAWVMVATWLGTLGLIGATIFVAIYFRLLATNDSVLVGLLPFAFPVIVLASLAVGVVIRLIRPREPRRDAIAAAAVTADPAEGSTTSFPVEGDLRAGAWVVRYKDAFGRDMTSEPRPTLEAAMARAHALQARGAGTILAVAAATPEAT